MTDTMGIYRDDYNSRTVYLNAYRAACKEYEFKVRVEGGWKFFRYANDFQTWKNQK